MKYFIPSVEKRGILLQLKQNFRTNCGLLDKSLFLQKDTLKYNKISENKANQGCESIDG